MTDVPRRLDPALALLSPQERARAASIGPQDVALLVFMVEDQRYAVELHRAREILRTRRPTRLPRTPSYVDGIVSVRGQAMPVVDVARRLGLKATAPSAEARFLVVHLFGNEPAALRVARVVGVQRLRPELVGAPNPALPMVRAVALEAEETRILDLDALLERPLASPEPERAVHPEPGPETR